MESPVPCWDYRWGANPCTIRPRAGSTLRFNFTPKPSRLTRVPYEISFNFFLPRMMIRTTWSSCSTIGLLPGGIDSTPSGHTVQAPAFDPTRAERKAILVGAGPKPPAWSTMRRSSRHRLVRRRGAGLLRIALLCGFRVAATSAAGAVQQGTRSLVKQGHSENEYRAERCLTGVVLPIPPIGSVPRGPSGRTVYRIFSPCARLPALFPGAVPAKNPELRAPARGADFAARWIAGPWRVYGE